MAEMTIARIAVSGVPYRLDRPFDYSIPEGLADGVRPGVRVEVPFTKANRRTEGIVLALTEVSAYEKLKPVLSVLDEEPLPADQYPNISIESFVGYLHNSHDYFLGFRLSAIRRKLMEALDYRLGDVSMAIMRFFDEYVGEVRKHMLYEEQTLFPYVHRLLAGEKPAGYDIDRFERQHNSVEAKMTELKNILIKYYPAKEHNALNDVLFDIFTTEADLASHNFVENNLFVPLVKSVEDKILQKP